MITPPASALQVLLVLQACATTLCSEYTSLFIRNLLSVVKWYKNSLSNVHISQGWPSVSYSARSSEKRNDSWGTEAVHRCSGKLLSLFQLPCIPKHCFCCHLCCSYSMFVGDLLRFTVKFVLFEIRFHFVTPGDLPASVSWVLGQQMCNPMPSRMVPTPTPQASVYPWWLRNCSVDQAGLNYVEVFLPVSPKY